MGQPRREGGLKLIETICDKLMVGSTGKVGERENAKEFRLLLKAMSHLILSPSNIQDPVKPSPKTPLLSYSSPLPGGN